MECYESMFLQDIPLFFNVKAKFSALCASALSELHKQAFKVVFRKSKILPVKLSHQFSSLKKDVLTHLKSVRL